MKKLIQKKMQASTLPEVLISMVIIMAVFTAAITIYVRITSSGTSVTDRQVYGEMTRIISQSIEESDWDTGKIEVDSITYEKTVSTYHDYKTLYVLQVTAKRHEELLGTMRRIVKIED